MNKRNLSFLAALVAGLVADQATKSWVVRDIEYVSDEISLIDGWLSFVHAQNTGAAFSTMEGQMTLFHVFATLAIIVIVHLLRQQAKNLVFVPVTLGLILSGALGNEIDRILKGHVTDFIKVYAGHEPLRSKCIEMFGTNIWPIFNVADSMLLVGVVMFALYWALQRDEDVLTEDDEQTTPEVA